MNTRLRSVTGALVGLGLVLTACGGSSNDDTIDTQGWTSRGVVETFGEGNIPTTFVGPLSTFDPESKGLSFTNDGSAFKAFVHDFTAKFPTDLMYDGQVFVVDDLSDLRDLKSYFTEEYGHGPTWVFTNEGCGLLVEIDHSLPRAQAQEYEYVIQRIC